MYFLTSNNNTTWEKSNGKQWSKAKWKLFKMYPAVQINLIQYPTAPSEISELIKLFCSGRDSNERLLTKTYSKCDQLGKSKWWKQLISVAVELPPWKMQFY